MPTPKKHPLGYSAYNPNPLKNRVGDCVVRALVKATNQKWDVVYLGLCELGFQLKAMPNDAKTWKAYLIKHGFVYCSIPAVKKGGKRPTVKSFTQANPTGTYVLKVARHVVASKNGTYYDSWNSGEKSLYGYWKKN